MPAGENKPKAKTKNRRKKQKQYPIAGFVSMRDPVGLSAEAETLEGMAEYRRKDETQIVIPEINILTELTDEGKLSARRAYQINWLLPDPDNKRGALIHVDRFHVAIHNDGAFDCNIIMQQPFGHEAAPSSLAAWVLIANVTVKAGSSLVRSVTPSDNNFVVPLRCDVKGTDCLVPCVFSAVRQALSNSGSVVPKSELGLRILVEAHYKAAGNALQAGSFFSMRTYADDTLMSHVDPKPTGPLPIRAVAPGARRLKWATGTLKSVSRVAAIITDASGTPIVEEQWTGLSPVHVYSLPVAVTAADFQRNPRQGAYLRHFAAVDTGDTKSGWYLLSEPDLAQEYALCDGDGKASPKTQQMVTLVADHMLTPLKNSNFPTIQVRKGGVSPQTPPLQGRNLRGSKFQDDVLTAVSFIVGVIKTAAAVAGALGLMNVVGDDEDGFSHC